jgi:hypothetical protein
LEVEVGNYTPTARKVSVDVTLGDSTCRLTGTCPAGRRTTLSEEIGSRRPGWLSGEARLVGIDDALAADNVYPFVLQVRRQPTYALITRQPKGRKATSSLFLECALAPTARKGKTPGGDAPRVVRIDPAAFDQSAAASGDMILLDHPGKLGDEAVKLLAALLHRGRPMIYVAAESIDATNLKRLGEATGGGLQMPVEFAPPPAGHVRRDLFITAVQRESPPFGVFGDNLASTIGRLRFSGGLGSRRLDTGMTADLLASYNDGSAAVVLTATDAGALAVINADLGASNLPKTSAFVPILSELVEQMLNRHRSSGGTFCGEPLAAHLPAEIGSARGLRVRGPNESGNNGEHANRGELADDAGGVVWRWASPGPPGVYRIERDAEPAFALAVTVPDDESQLDTLPQDVLTGRLAAGRPTAYRGAADEGRQRDDFWKWFAVACVGCVLGEIGALITFRT